MSEEQLNNRIEILELKLMDLENTVHGLDQVILRLYRDIERLQLQQEELLNRPSAGSSAANPSAVDEIPPHY